jgi:hypothetical protein
VVLRWSHPTKVCGGITLPSFRYPTLHTVQQRTHTNTTHTAHKHKMSRCHPTPTAALPLLSMATSAMDPNCGAGAPYESIAGTRRPGSRSLQLIPLIGAPKWHPSKNERWAEHRPWVAAPQWGNTTTNHRLLAAAGGALKRRRSWGGTCGEDDYPSFGAAN